MFARLKLTGVFSTSGAACPRRCRGLLLLSVGTLVLSHVSLLVLCCAVAFQRGGRQPLFWDGLLEVWQVLVFVSSSLHSRPFSPVIQTLGSLVVPKMITWVCFALLYETASKTSKYWLRLSPSMSWGVLRGRDNWLAWVCGVVGEQQVQYQMVPVHRTSLVAGTLLSLFLVYLYKFKSVPGTDKD